MRRAAIAALLDVERGAHSTERLRTNEQPFVREAVLGVLRRQLTLDAIHDAWGKRPASDLDPEVRAAIRLGLYQLHFMDGVPPHAAVDETVGAVGRASARSYVNGVLRRIGRESRKVPPDADRGGASPTKRLERPGRSVSFFSKKVFPDPEADRAGYLAVLHSHPRWIVERWLEHVGEEQTLERLRRGNEVPNLMLRPRRGRIDAEGLARKLVAEGAPARVFAREHGDDAVEVPGNKSRNVFRGDAWKAGLCSVQDPSQMDAVELLDPQPGETVWDACAAPGGKACQIAERLDGNGLLVASDENARRLDKLLPGLQGVGLADGVRIVPHDVLADEGPKGKPSAGFDAILLDVPCSNSAVFGRRPEARWRIQPESLDQLHELQARMIAAARVHLAPGGRMVYSVCSFEPEEGERHGLEATHSPLAWTTDARAPQSDAPVGGSVGFGWQDDPGAG